VPSIDAKIDELKREPTLTQQVNAAWAALDRDVMQVLWAPYINHEQTDFFGSDVDMTCYASRSSSSSNGSTSAKSHDRAGVFAARKERTLLMDGTMPFCS
jgi:hypothetical protein